MPERISRWVECFKSAADKWNVDPVILAAICERESKGGAALMPIGPTGTGDGGHGRGLMQIDDRTWGEWLSTHFWQSPIVNITKGAEILATNLLILKGYMPGAICAYNAGPSAARRALIGTQDVPERDKIAKLDAVTAGHNYVSAVLILAEAFRNP